MNCIGFPKMFNGNSSIVLYDMDATKTCVHLLLGSEQGELFGDPEFGLRLKRYLYDQNNYILRDILIDEICEQLRVFCPQIVVRREDVSITQDKSSLYAHIKCINRIDFTTNMFDIVLLQDEEREIS